MDNHKKTWTCQQQLQDIINSEDDYKEKREFVKAQELYTNWLYECVKNGAPDKPKDWDWEWDWEQSLKSAQWEFNQEMKQKIALAFNNRGQLKYLAVDFDGAIEDYNSALNFNEHLPCSYYNRGTIFYRMGYFDKAFKDLKKSTELSPETKEFQLGLERCQQELNTRKS